MGRKQNQTIISLLWIILLLPGWKSEAQKIHLESLQSPVIFKGNDHLAYRDPAVLCHNGTFFLFFTLTEIEKDGMIFMYTASSRSTDLVHWTSPRKLTPRDRNLNYSSPGNILRYRGEWLLCLQSYPRPGNTVRNMPQYGNNSARIFLLRSKDLENWSEPELMKVKGTTVPVADMGRMIDPYLLQDKDDSTKFWCFYKQNGVSSSWTRDFKEWTFFGHTESGENTCVMVENNQYILFHSPPNGIGIKRSADLKTWKEWGKLITLGQSEWEWAKGRITAGAVIPLLGMPQAKYLMFFHGSGPLTEKEGDFDKNSSIGIAWSNDLITWVWPGKKKQ